MKPMTTLERFENLYIPEPNTGCWLWLGHLQRGYGRFEIGRRGQRQTFLAHRFSYELHKGPIPEGLTLDHLCRVRCCVNPNHVEPVTNKENCRRGQCVEVLRSINANKTKCPQGHTYDCAYRYGQKGYRGCRICRRQQFHNWYAKRHAV